MKKLKDINALKSIKEAIGTNGITIIVVAALLLIAINIIQYKFAEKEINEDVRLRALSELTAKSLAIRNVMNQVEVAVKNHKEDVSRLIEFPDSMFGVAGNLVAQNDIVTGSSVSFIEEYYPEKGRWFEAYAVRKNNSEIDTMQLGNSNHDYFLREFFTLPMQTGKGEWTNPYLDKEGAKMMLTTYAEPIYSKNGEIVAVLDADISLEWLDDILKVEYAYPSSYHVLLSGKGELMSVADKNYLMKTITEMGKDYGNETFESLNKGMMSGESGETVIKDKKGQKYRAFYMPVGGDTGWSIAIINSEKEIFADFHKMKVSLLWLSIGGFVIIILLMIRAITNINRLQKVTGERERIKSELTIAGEIQLGMLPKDSTLEGASEKIEVSTILRPAKEVGGDLYDYFVRNDFLYFCIGDVSGKGVPASLFMAVARSLFRALGASSLSSAKIVSAMNATLSEINERNMFVTLFMGIVDLKTGRLDYVNCGHDAPVILDKHGVALLNVIPNLPLGIFPDFIYESQKVQLRKDSIIFLYTDGLTEAMNPEHKEFGEERMMKALNMYHHKDTESNPLSLLNFIDSRVSDFADKAEQSDDLTMMAFKFIKSDLNLEKTITLGHDISEIKQLNLFVDETAAECHWETEFTMELKLAIEEAVVNIINHGFVGIENGRISVSLKIQDEEVLVEIIDNGTYFDPSLVEQPDLNLSTDQRPIGGLGIHLINQLTDSISYRRVNNHNILNLSKRFNNENFIN